MKALNPYSPLPCLNPSPYGEHPSGPVPPSAVMDPYYYSVPDGQRLDDGMRLVRRLLYHLDKRSIAVISEGRYAPLNLSDERIHSVVFGMAYAGVSGARAERMSLALQLCKHLRTQLGFAETQTFIQAPDAVLGGRTPLEVLAKWPLRKARRILQPIMMMHLFLGVRRAISLMQPLQSHL